MFYLNFRVSDCTRARLRWFQNVFMNVLKHWKICSWTKNVFWICSKLCYMFRDSVMNKSTRMNSMGGLSVKYPGLHFMKFSLWMNFLGVPYFGNMLFGSKIRSQNKNFTWRTYGMNRLKRRQNLEFRKSEF